MERVALDCVPSEEQMADILTKALPTPLVSIFHQKFFVPTKAWWALHATSPPHLS